MFQKGSWQVSDPNDPYARVLEPKTPLTPITRLIWSVIMDVYNHVYQADEYALNRSFCHRYNAEETDQWTFCGKDVSVPWWDTISSNPSNNGFPLRLWGSLDLMGTCDIRTEIKKNLWNLSYYLSLWGEGWKMDTGLSWRSACSPV